MMKELTIAYTNPNQAYRNLSLKSLFFVQGFKDSVAMLQRCKV